MEKYEEVERALIKKHRKKIWSKFVRAISDYEMIKEGDSIAVCISGGKDSMLLAKCMQEIHKHGEVNFSLKFLVMDPGYSQLNRAKILENAKKLKLDLTIFNTDIFNIVADIKDSPCYLCARMRRGYLYKNAQKLGCNKIALGHHFDDVIETILMGMLYGGQIQTMMPKLHSTNHEGMELIRPLYLVKEADIISWAKGHELDFIQCACRFTEELAKEGADGSSKRLEMKELINKFRSINPCIEMNIFRSVHNVNLSTIIGYKDGDNEYSFLDKYEEKRRSI